MWLPFDFKTFLEISALYWCFLLQMVLQWSSEILLMADCHIFEGKNAGNPCMWIIFLLESVYYFFTSSVLFHIRMAQVSWKEDSKKFCRFLGGDVIHPHLHGGCHMAQEEEHPTLSIPFCAAGRSPILCHCSASTPFSFDYFGYVYLRYDS